MEFNAAVRLFDRYLENELTEVQRKALEEFLEKDEACAAELARYRRVHDVVHAYLESTRPGEGFVEDVMVGVEEAEAPRKRRRSQDRRTADDSGSRSAMPLLAVILLLLVVGGGGYWMFFLRGPGGVAEVVSVARSAERMLGGGVTRELAVGDTLESGESLRATGGNVRLVLTDRTEVTMVDGAVLQVGDDDARAHRIRTGTVRFAVTDGEDRFEVEFDAGRARVLASEEGESRFGVTVPESEAETTDLEVTRGRVQLVTASGSQDVDAGMRSSARKNATPARPVAIRTKSTESNRDRRRDKDRDRTARANTDSGNQAARSGSNRSSNPATGRDNPAAPAKASLDDTLTKLRDPSTDPAATRAALQALNTALVGDRVDEVRLLLADILRQDPDENVRREAFSRLVALKPEGLFEDAVEVLQNDESLAIRKLALTQVSAGEDKDEVRRVLGDALLTPYSLELLPLKKDMLTAFGKVATVDDLQVFLDVVQGDQEGDLAKAALSAVAGVKSADAVDALLPFLREDNEAMREGAVAGLRRLTGKTVGYDPKAEPALRDEAAALWEDWWAENRDTFEF